MIGIGQRPTMKKRKKSFKGWAGPNWSKYFKIGEESLDTPAVIMSPTMHVPTVFSIKWGEFYKHVRITIEEL